MGKFKIAQKPDRFERAKTFDRRAKEQNGRGTHRSEGSNLILLWKSTAVKGKESIKRMRKKHKHSKRKVFK